MGNFIKENWFKLAIVIALLLVAYAIYYSLVITPENTRIREETAKILAREAEKSQEQERQDNIDSCLADARSVYDDNWHSSCKDLGSLSERCEIILFEPNPLDKYIEWHPELKDKEILERLTSFENAKTECSCSLPTQMANRWDTLYKESQQACYSRYGSL